MKHFDERPLRPLVVFGIARAHLPAPIVREPDLVQLFSVPLDIFFGSNGRVLSRLYGILLCRQPIRVVSHRV